MLKAIIPLIALVFSIFQRSLWARQAERCVQRSCVVCPQADVICTCGALDVAEPRWLVILCGRPRAVVAIVVIVALAGIVVLRGGAVYFIEND